MIDYMNIAFTVLFSQNLLLVFTFAFGTDPKTFLRPRHSFFTGVALTIALSLLAPLSRVVDQLLLLWGMSYFSLLSQSLLAFMGTYWLSHFMKKISPDLWQYAGDSLNALPTNGGVLAVLLLCNQYNYTIFESLIFGFFAGIGVLVALLSLVGIRQNLEFRQTPDCFRGLPFLFITAGLLSMSLVGFYGFHFS